LIQGEMMPNAISSFGFVRKSGDTMTGDLRLGEHKLFLGLPDSEIYLMINPAAVYELLIEDFEDLGQATLKTGFVKPMHSVDMRYADGHILMADAGKVDGVDVSEIHQAKIKTGTYIGNGVDNRNIDIGVDLAGKLNAYVIIKSSVLSKAVHRTEYGQGDLSMFYDSTYDATDKIQAFTSTGFQVGVSSTVNEDGGTYRYIAFWQE